MAHRTGQHTRLTRWPEVVPVDWRVRRPGRCCSVAASLIAGPSPGGMLDVSAAAEQRGCSGAVPALGRQNTDRGSHT